MEAQVNEVFCLILGLENDIEIMKKIPFEKRCYLLKRIVHIRNKFGEIRENLGISVQEMSLYGLLQKGIELEDDEILDLALNGLEGEPVEVRYIDKVRNGKKIFNTQFAKDINVSTADTLI